jgi:hypothetical protein
MTPHACPHCRCHPHDDGYRMAPVNKTAEFYPLVELIDQLEHVDPRMNDGRRGPMRAWRTPRKVDA